MRSIFRKRVLALALCAGALPIALVSNGCASSYPNQDPTGSVFPMVVGQSLKEEERRLPDDLSGRPAVLLVGYKQGAQFDIDRWFMGLLQADVDAQIIEVPTIPGLVPTLASGWIDDGMRSGIPEEDWGAVVTLYGKAAKPVAELTGTERGRLARILVLDASGMIVWFDDTGYSARKAMEIAEVVSTLNSEE